MKFNQKGQSALEYLMTYGWALVVIVVVVAALVLLVGNPAQAADTCSGPGSGLNVTNQELTTTGWQIKVSNISARTLALASGTGGCDASCGIRGSTDGGTPASYTTGTSLAPGSQLTLDGPDATAGQHRTDFNAVYHDGDFIRTVAWSCSGTA